MQLYLLWLTHVTCEGVRKSPKISIFQRRKTKLGKASSWITFSSSTLCCLWRGVRAQGMHPAFLQHLFMALTTAGKGTSQAGPPPGPWPPSQPHPAASAFFADAIGLQPDARGVATSLGLNERLFVVNPQEVHKLVGPWVGARGQGRPLLRAPEVLGRGRSGCSWGCRKNRKVWTLGDGEIPKMRGGCCWL